MKSSITHRRAIPALVVVVSLLIAAFAATSSASAATIYACQKKKGGTIHIVTKKAKCKKGETKISWNSQGVPGANGSNGAAGKEGTAGKNGTNGLNGTALAYAEVSSAGNLTQSKGVTAMTPGKKPLTGVYCLDIPGTLHVGVATSDSFGGGTVPSLDAVDMAPLFEVIFEDCEVGTTVAVHTYNFKAEAAEAGFFLDVN